MKLIDPVPQDTRSAQTDWLELIALSAERRQASEASLIGLLELYGGGGDASFSREPETSETLDESILESAQEQSVQAVVDEILYRQEVLHGHYPFLAKPRGVLLSFLKSERDLTTGEWVYLFCLLSSGIRENRFQPRPNDLEKRIPALFQVCACLAAAGYLSGSVSSFGFPRATGTAFLPALRKAYTRFGEGRVRQDDDVPPGFPTALKDAGIDIIAWKDFPDKLPGKLYLLGQCASGLNWTSKAIKQDIPQFHGGWFMGGPASEATNAMFIPFTFHHTIEDSEAEAFPELLKNGLWYATFKFGVIHDRLRIAYFSELGFSLPHRGEIDDADKLEDVKTWVREVLNSVREN